MPYTISHAVIALPINKLITQKIPIASIIVGSISPDFPYLIALKPVHAPGHTTLGVLIYCLLPSLILLSIWYKWLEKPNLDLLGLQQRNQQFSKRQFFLLNIVGVLLGAYSHVLWDATSHVHSTFVQNSEFLTTTFFNLPAYKWNQYLSGILGLFVLGIWYLVAAIKNRHNTYRGQLKLGLAIYLTSILLLVASANIIHQSVSLADFALRTAIGVITGSTIAASIYAFRNIMKL